jgi:hypothetical protein
MYLTKFLFFSIFTITLFFFVSFLPAQSSEANTLIGSWQTSPEMGPIILIFHSANQLEFDGEMASYTLVPGAIRMTDYEGTYDYPYTLQGNTLIISFPDGYQLEFFRKDASGYSPATPAPTSPQMIPQQSFQPSQVQQSAQPSTGSTSLSAGEVGNPQWGFAFKPPAGWKYQQNEQGILLGHDQIPGMIIVFPHTYNNIQAVQQAMMEGLQEEGVYMTPSTQLQQTAQNSLMAEYQGIWQGSQAKGCGVGTLSPYGGGAMIMAVTTTDKYGSQQSEPARQIAQSLRYFQVEVSDLMRHFAGYWWYYSGTAAISHEKLIHLAPDGTYRDKREDAADVGNYDQYGNLQNQYLGNFQDRGYGRWTPRGNKFEGVITVTRADGSTFDIEYRVKPSNPQKFGDYYFNGTLYHYATEEDLKMMDY